MEKRKIMGLRKWGKRIFRELLRIFIFLVIAMFLSVNMPMFSLHKKIDKITVSFTGKVNKLVEIIEPDEIETVLNKLKKNFYYPVPFKTNSDASKDIYIKFMKDDELIFHLFYDREKRLLCSGWQAGRPVNKEIYQVLDGLIGDGK